MKRNLIYLTIFAVAMGFLESVVVFFIRKAYYPEGFAFPIKLLSSEIIRVEFFREISTVIMLLCVAIIVGRNLNERFGSFIYVFGVWDIFYYIWLKVLLNWPSSFFTWDVLFLVPVGWIGPVLAPIILSVIMLIFSSMIFYREEHKNDGRMNKKEWTLLITGSLIVVWTFIRDYVMLIIENRNISSNQALREILAQHVPTYYSWPLFSFGSALILYAIWLFYKRD